MKRTLWAIFAMGVLVTPVRAQEDLWFDNYCVMGSFQVCASVRLHSGSDNSLTMQVWNLEGTLGDSHTMTSIGFYHAGAAWTGTVTDLSVSHVTDLDPETKTDITDYWTDKGANDIGTLAGVKVELKEGTTGNVGINGCTELSGGTKWRTCNSFADAPYVEFVFTLSEEFALADTELRWHSQQLPNESSVKCDTGGAGGYGPCVGTVVPEPATFALLGTGLLGLFGVARLRRREDVDIETE